MFFPFAESRMKQAERERERRRQQRDAYVNRQRHFPLYPCPVVVGGHVGVNVTFAMLIGGPPSQFAALIDQLVPPDVVDEPPPKVDPVLPLKLSQEVALLRQRVKYPSGGEDDWDFCTLIFNDDDHSGLLSGALRRFIEDALEADDSGSSSSEDDEPPVLVEDEISEERHERLVYAVQRRLGVLILVADPATTICCWTLHPPNIDNHRGAKLLSFSPPGVLAPDRLAYYLPYAADRMTCVLLGDAADWFFTDLMEGCSLRIVGTKSAPLVCHVNVRSINNVECKRDVVQVLLDSAPGVINTFSTVSATLLRSEYFEQGYTAFVWGMRDRRTGHWRFFVCRQTLSPLGLHASHVVSTERLL